MDISLIHAGESSMLTDRIPLTEKHSRMMTEHLI